MRTKRNKDKIRPSGAGPGPRPTKERKTVTENDPVPYKVLFNKETAHIISLELVSLEIKMGGKKKIDPATGKRMKYPSDFKGRTTEQNATRNAARHQKGMDGGKFRPNKHTKVHF